MFILVLMKFSHNNANILDIPIMKATNELKLIADVKILIIIFKKYAYISINKFVLAKKIIYSFQIVLWY